MFQLPNQGRFTLYSFAAGAIACSKEMKEAGIPRLMPGSDGEWMRLAFAIFGKHSDMSRLVGLSRNALDRVLVMETWMRRWKEECQHP